jgi:hypothetical protein
MTTSELVSYNINNEFFIFNDFFILIGWKKEVLRITEGGDGTRWVEWIIRHLTIMS